MRMKHWQGYGFIEARNLGKKYDKNRDLYTQQIELSGNHEWGIDLSNRADLIESWLLPKFNREKDKDIRYRVEDFDVTYATYTPVESIIYKIQFRKVKY